MTVQSGESEGQSGNSGGPPPHPNRKRWWTSAAALAIIGLIIASLSLLRDTFNIQLPFSQPSGSTSQSSIPEPGSGAPVGEMSPEATPGAPPGSDDSGRSPDKEGRGGDDSAPAPLKLTGLSVEALDSTYRVQNGVYRIYQFGDYLHVGYTWTVESNYGPVNGDCDVTGSTYSSDGSLVEQDLLDSCNPTLTPSARLTPGDYTIEVTVRYQGQEVSNSVKVKVLPPAS